MTELRIQMTDGRGQKIEVGSGKWEFGRRNGEAGKGRAECG